MFKTFALISSLAISTSAFATSQIIKNINGYSVNNDGVTKFHAIKITDSKIDKIYLTGDKVEKHPDIKFIDGQGKTMIPGLIDAHGHVLGYGLSLLRVDLNNTSSEQNAIDKAYAFWKKNKNVPWLLGRGWNQSRWENNRFPSASNLDEYFKDVPVWFKRVDGHAGWANTKAMELAGVTRNTVSPEGGQIIKDKNGKPTGVFVDNAMALISSKIPSLTDEQIESALLKSMEALAADGITSVHDAGVGPDVLEAYQNLSKNHKMPIRISAMLAAASSSAEAYLKAGIVKTEDGMYQLNSVKISSDGALGSRGAAMIKPYSDHPGHTGLLLHREDKLKALMKISMEHGFQVNTHAIGDHANKLVLDLYESLIEKTDTKSLRHRVEHAQILRLKDIPRFKELGVIASMQSTHATSDKNMAEDRVGPKRILGAYAWRSLLDSGAIIASGSDFPVESANPFFGLHAAVTRQDKENLPADGWYPNERMTMAEALKSFTLDAAYAAHQENIIGSLDEGKLADFIILDQDIMSIEPKNIWKTKVLETWVNGKKVYQAN